MFNFKEATQHFIFDPIKRIFSRVQNRPIVATDETTEETMPLNLYQSRNEYSPKVVEAAKNSLRWMESRGEKEPYSFYQPSGIQELGDALGAYQITEAKLKEFSKKFLGKTVTREEFLKNPTLQDKFAESEIKYLLDNNFKINSLFAAHRGGWSDMRREATMRRNQRYKVYMDEAIAKYNEFLNE